MAGQSEINNNNAQCARRHTEQSDLETLVTALEGEMEAQQDTPDLPDETDEAPRPAVSGRQRLRQRMNLSDAEAAELKRTIRAAIEAISLPDEFYTTPELRQLRAAASQYMGHPDGVLVSALSILSSVLHPSCTIEIGGGPIRPNFYAGVVSPPGGGKDRCLDAARAVLPVDLLEAEEDAPRCAPLGSGEGLLDLYLGTQKSEDGEPEVVQTRSRVLVTQAEASNMFALMDRSSSTLASNLLNMWGGGEVGTSNTTAGGRTRRLSSGTYRFAMTVGFQPAMIANLLARGDVGFPHRFVLANAIPYHRDRSDETFIPLEGRLRDVARLRDTRLTVVPSILRRLDALSLQQLGDMASFEHTTATDSHLFVILVKLTCLIGLLHGRVVATEDDFERALDIAGTSQDVRERAQKVAEELERSENAAKARQIDHIDEVRENRRDVRRGTSTLMSQAMQRMVAKAKKDGLATARDVKKALNNRLVTKIREAGLSDSPREDAFASAVQMGLLEETDRGVKAGPNA